MLDSNEARTELARRTAGPIFKIPAHPMAAAQLAAPQKLGVPSMPFYVLARGAALGPVRPEVIAAAFVWFEPGFIADAHATATQTLSAAAAEDFWRTEMFAWAEQTLSDDRSIDRLATLLARVVEEASCAQAPLFAGWRALRVPATPASAVLHHLYALRELRNAVHANAILAAGLSPLDAVKIRTPWIAQMYGWPASDDPDPEDPHFDTAGSLIDIWAEAEETTDRLMGVAFSALIPSEGNELADLLDETLRRTGALWTDDSESPATTPVPVVGVPA